MKLEEALPLYREGKILMSCRGDQYHIANFDSSYTLATAVNDELLGEWTVKKEKRKVKRTVWINVYPEYDQLHSSEKAANNCCSDKRITCVETTIEYEVEE